MRRCGLESTRITVAIQPSRPRVVVYWLGDLAPAPGDPGSAVVTCESEGSGGVQGRGAAGYRTLTDGRLRPVSSSASQSLKSSTCSCVLRCPVSYARISRFGAVMTL